jgi:hypothetical protein
MAKSDSGPGSCVMVVGDLAGEAVQAIVRLTREEAIDAVPCANVYSAVARMAGMTARRLLVIGTIQELGRHDGAFFRMAATHGVRCCCLLDHGNRAVPPVHGVPQRGSAQWQARDLLAALQAGVSFLGDAQDVRRVLQEWHTGQGAAAHDQIPERTGRNALRARRHRADTPEATYEDLRATEAELSALLG